MIPSIPPLPKIMVAPNGARRTTADHPAIPVTIPDIVRTARACHAAGAGGIHAHVRDTRQRHVLDAGLYRELIAELETAVPKMTVQITTEAVGHYKPKQQRDTVYMVKPHAVSVALKEMIPRAGSNATRNFYHWARDEGIAVQHILYDPAELRRLKAFIAGKVIPIDNLQLLFVLGRYAKNQESNPDDLAPFLKALEKNRMGDADWAICAFGVGETACLNEALKQGGKVRVGFENSLWNADGSIARDNAERVAKIAKISAATATG